MSDLTVGVGWYVSFLVAAVFHEAAHALAARLGGDDTAYHGGQVSLDPLPHIRREPFGMVVLPLICLLIPGINWPFGYASAPYDPAWAERHSRRAALMALAGPAANFLLCLAAGLLIRLGLELGVFAPFPPGAHDLSFSLVDAPAGGIWTGVACLVSMFFVMNLILALFNLLPLPPLDGSGVPPLFLSEPLARRWRDLMHQPLFALVGLLLAWQVFPYVVGPILVRLAPFLLG